MASELRRRVAKGKEGGDTVPTEPVTPAARDQSPIKPGEEVKVVHEKRKRSLGAIFLLGSLFGIIAAGFFAKSNDLIDFPEIGELSVDNLLDVVPAGLVKDVRDLVVRSSSCNGHVCQVCNQSDYRTLIRKASATTWTRMSPSPSVSKPKPRAWMPTIR